MDFNYETEYSYTEYTECAEYADSIKGDQELGEITQGLGFAFIGAALVIFLVMCAKEKFNFKKIFKKFF